MELIKFASKNEVGLSQELEALNLDLGMIHDLYRQVQLKLSFWKVNNQINSIYKASLSLSEVQDLKKFKESIDPLFLELLTKSLRLYINMKCSEENKNILPLNLFEFMSYTEIGLIDIQCWSAEVTLTLPQDYGEEEIVSKPKSFTYVFEKVLTHDKIFEILQNLET